MRIAKAILICWVVSSLILWVRGWRGFCVLDAMPWVSRSSHLPPVYDMAAVAMILLGCWGFCRLRQGGD